MQQKLSDWERLECVIEWANMTTNYFARSIGLSRGENLYQIKKGNNRISRKIADLIVARHPQVSMLWLLTGEGSMLSGAENRSGVIPLYNVGVEESIRDVGSLQPSSDLMIPLEIEIDLAMLYLGRAMGDVVPTNSVVLLKKILPEMIIPGDECVIVTKKIVLLRIAKVETTPAGAPALRLIATNSELFGDVVVSVEDVESAYVIKGKILINR